MMSFGHRSTFHHRHQDPFAGGPTREHAVDATVGQERRQLPNALFFQVQSVVREGGVTAAAIAPYSGMAGDYSVGCGSPSSRRSGRSGFESMDPAPVIASTHDRPPATPSMIPCPL